MRLFVLTILSAVLVSASFPYKGAATSSASLGDEVKTQCESAITERIAAVKARNKNVHWEIVDTDGVPREVTEKEFVQIFVDVCVADQKASALSPDPPNPSNSPEEDSEPVGPPVPV